MTTAKLYFPTTTMTFTRAATRREQPARGNTNEPAYMINPFVRRPREQLSRRERAGLLVIYAAVTAVVSMAVIRADRAPAPLRATPSSSAVAAQR